MTKLLVVDDSLASRHVLRSLAERAGYTVTEAASGAEALRLLRRHCFEVMLLDIMMPEMDGITLLARMQEEVLPHHPVVVIVSAIGLSEIRSQVQRFGVRYVLSKPFTRKEFLSVLEAALAEAKPCPEEPDQY